MFETIITCKCVSVLKDEMIFAVKKKKKKAVANPTEKTLSGFCMQTSL